LSDSERADLKVGPYELKVGPYELKVGPYELRAARYCQLPADHAPVIRRATSELTWIFMPCFAFDM